MYMIILKSESMQNDSFIKGHFLPIDVLRKIICIIYIKSNITDDQTLWDRGL